MKVVSVAFVVLLAASALLMLYRNLRDRQSQKSAEEENLRRNTEQADKEKFQRDQLQAAATRERLQDVAVPHQEWPRQFSSVYDRLTANLPPAPHARLHPIEYAAVPFHREVTENDLPLPIEYEPEEATA